MRARGRSGSTYRAFRAGSTGRPSRPRESGSPSSRRAGAAGRIAPSSRHSAGPTRTSRPTGSRPSRPGSASVRITAPSRAARRPPTRERMRSPRPTSSSRRSARCSSGELIPVLDAESPFTGMTSTSLRTWIRVFVKRVTKKLGRKPMIYTNASSWSATGEHGRVRQGQVPAVGRRMGCLAADRAGEQLGAPRLLGLAVHELGQRPGHLGPRRHGPARQAPRQDHRSLRNGGRAGLSPLAQVLASSSLPRSS